MVAPISVTVPSSTSCRRPSCWVRLKRWISSMNRIGRRPRARCFLRLLEALAEVGHARPSPPTAPSAARRTSLASSRASVVLPQPGGPHRISEASRPALQHPRQRRLGPQELLLAHQLRQRLRPQPVGERPVGLGARRRRGRLGLDAGRTGRAWPQSSRRAQSGKLDHQPIMGRQHARRQPRAPVGVVDLMVHVGEIGPRGLDPSIQESASDRWAWLGCGLSRSASTIQTSTPRRAAKRLVVEPVGVGRVGEAADAEAPGEPRPCFCGNGTISTGPTLNGPWKSSARSRGATSHGRRGRRRRRRETARGSGRTRRRRPRRGPAP